MKIDKPINPNYSGTVIEVKNIINLENCSNVVAVSVFGYQAIVSNDIKIGDIGVFFPAESQLADEYCYQNSLYRHSEKNVLNNQKGYIEDNRRIRAIKFRGNTSNGLFMPLTSLSYTGIKPEMLSVGDEFDTLNGHEICKKYEVPRRVSNRAAQEQEKVFKRIDSIHMPEHYDSSNYFKWGDNIPNDATIIVTQKLHGTSIRIGNTIVKRKPKLIERIAKFLGATIAETEHDYVYGSKKVIKDINNPYQNHFYETDIWTTEGKKLWGILPQNYLVYGELVGYTPEGAEIQKNYSYSTEKGQAELYIYRISIVNNQGHITELAWEQVKDFCKRNNLKHVPELWIGKKSDFKAEEWVDKRYFEQGYKHCLYLGSNKDLVDEGVCVRMEANIPVIMKAKSPKFLEHETKLLDTGEADLESLQSEPVINPNTI